jgi:DNA-binding transcriptional LysR family regulator
MLASINNMNVHHLELFYYVARHGGIMPAVRNIPYGIQQPAVSAQVSELEEFLGVTLFQRRPFELTPAGTRLYAYIQPFFGNLARLTDELQGGQARHIRIGASTIVLRDHVPKLLQGLRKNFPTLKVTFREGFPAQFEKMLEQDEIDVAITLIDKKVPAGLQSLKLLELPMVLLVEKNCRLQSAAELWKRDKITDSLICLPPGESPSRLFLQQLRKLGVDWFPGVEASSTDLIETYVVNGMGIGLSVAVPKKSFPPQVRALPLTGFPLITIGALWRGKKSLLVEAFLAEAKRQADALS